MNLLGILGDEIAAADQQVADGAGMLAGGGESLGARTLEGLGGEGGIDPGRIHLAGGKGCRCRPGFQGHKFDVLGREARLFQDHQQQVMVDGALFGGHLFTLEIGDRVDTGGGNDLVVAGGEIIHQHHLLVGPTGDRADRVIEGLAIAIELASTEGIDRIEVAIEPLHLHRHPGFREQVFGFGDLPGEPTGPGAIADSHGRGLVDRFLASRQKSAG